MGAVVQRTSVGPHFDAEQQGNEKKPLNNDSFLLFHVVETSVNRDSDRGSHPIGDAPCPTPIGATTTDSSRFASYIHTG